jgi:DNA processing protein
MAERLAQGLSNMGATIVSGLARGIDAVCHEATLDAGGRTIAVLGSSLSDIYPPEHKKLAARICDSGLIISETHPFALPKAGVFPQRNRIISGMSLAVVVVEAADRSGSLITATHAGEQGRDVFAVPGPVTSRTSRGCNRLIRDGAILVQDAQDILEQLGPLTKSFHSSSGLEIKTPSEIQLNDMEQTILGAIDSQPTDIDVVITRCALPVARVLSTLSVLELRGFIVRTGGRSVARRY